ncbi:hypothetical protein FRC10_009488 [Ceratobasidium sp. 414]|nr:hypothetical protein FRC10_009488 [Ceratobasidium sp. 414]
MSEMRVRSKTGCLTCKNRTKRNPADLGPSSVAGPSAHPAGASSAPAVPENDLLDLAPSVPWNDVIPSGETWSFPPNVFGQGYPGLAAISALNDLSGISVLPGQAQTSTSATWWDTDFGLADIFSQPDHGSADTPPNPPAEQTLGVPLLLEPFPNDQIFIPDTLNAVVGGHNDLNVGQVYQSSLGLGVQTETSVSSYSASRVSPSYQGSVWPSPVAERDDDSSTADDDSDTEGVLDIFGPTLALDRGVSSNSLPFVISSYLRWTIRTTFEPRKIARRTRDQLVTRYMRSDDSRCGTTLVATIMESLLKNPGAGIGHFPAMAVLQCRVDQKLAMIKSSQKPLPDAHGSDVLAALHDVCEMVSVQRLTSPLSHFMKLLHDAAPVYREACSEPPGAPIHLPTKLLHSESVLRKFPAMDIILSLSTGRPMFLQYDVTQTPDICKRIVDNAGVQWMHGVPDHFLLMLARMNMLREEFSPNIDPLIVQELEFGIANFKPALDESPDPHLKVARLMVQESWRQVMYIYLYMVCSLLFA